MTFKYRFYILLLSALLCAIACNREDQLALEELQQELAQLQESATVNVPDALTPVPYVAGEFGFALDQEIFGIDAGTSVTIGFTLQEAATVEIQDKGDWSATVNYKDDKSGEIVISVPDPATYTDLVVTATTADGRKSAVILPLIVRNPYSDATRPRLGALGYYSFKPERASLENFQKLAEAGLTMVTMETDEYNSWEQLDMIHEAGLQALAIVGGYAGYWYSHMDDTRLDDVINRFKQHPAVYGWHICDEPSVDQIWELMAIEDKIGTLDPDHPVYVNLHPLASSGSLGVSTYYEYVNAFADMMHLKQLSFDMYPVLENSIQAGWHMCLATAADAAKRKGIPLWTFAASTWINQETLKRAKPTVENLLLQIYTDLAFGAQMVQYFTIMIYSGSNFAPYNYEGQWTEAYDILKEANLQMQRRAFIFKDSEVKMVRQIGVLPTYDEPLAKEELPEEIEDLIAGASATVSFLENNGNKYVVVVNNYWNLEQPIELDLRKPAYYIDSDAKFTLYGPGKWGFIIPPGGMLAFKYK